MILDIKIWDDPVLSEIALPVEEAEINTPKMAEFARDLIETMNLNGRGVGLAAPQVGVGRRIFAAKTLQYGDLVFINPEVGLEGTTTFDTEGCLSLPKIYDQVPRSISCSVKAYVQSQDGEFVERQFWFVDGIQNGGKDHWENIPARIIQHEFDHLNGIMFFDRVSRQVRKQIFRRWKKSQR